MAGKAIPIELILKAKDQASKTLGLVEKSIGGLAHAAKLGLAATGAAAAAAAGAIAKMTLDASKLEGVERAFEGITGGADAMLKKLQEGSSGMVANTELMQTYNLAAQLVSKTFADQLPDAMGYLQKVSAATGQSMGYMMESLVRGVGRLSPMILDNLAIQVDLTAAYDEYAQSIGKSAAELTKQEQQTALMNQVMAKLAENTASMPEVNDTLAASVARMRAQWSNTTYEIGKAFLPIAAQVADTVLPLISKGMQALVPAAQGLAGVIGALAKYFAFAVSEGDTLNDFLADLPKPIQPVVQRLAELALWLREYVPRAIDTVRAFVDTTLLPALQNIGAFIQDPLLPAIGTLVSFLQENIPRAVEFLKGAMEKGREVFERVAGFVKEHIVPILATTLVPLLGIIIPGAIAAVKVAFAGFVAHVAAIAGPVIAALSPILVPIAAIGLAVALLKKAWDTNFGGIRDIVANIWQNTLQPTLQRLVEWLQTNVPVAIERARDFFEGTLVPALQTAWDFIKEKVLTILSDLSVWLAEHIPVAIEKLRQWWDETAIPALQRLWDHLNTYILPILRDLRDWISDRLPEAVDLLKGILEKLVEFWNDQLLPAFETLWAFIQDPLIPILSDLAGIAFEAVLDIITGIHKFWEDHLKKTLEALWEKLEALWEIVTEDVIPKLLELKNDVLGPLKRGFDLVKGAIEWVIGKFNELKSAIENFMSDPVRAIIDLILPGSPPPLADGMMQVAAATDQATDAFYRLGYAMQAAGAGGGGLMHEITNLQEEVLPGLQHEIIRLQEEILPGLQHEIISEGDIGRLLVEVLPTVKTGEVAITPTAAGAKGGGGGGVPILMSVEEYPQFGKPPEGFVFDEFGQLWPHPTAWEWRQGYQDYLDPQTGQWRRRRLRSGPIPEAAWGMAGAEPRTSETTITPGPPGAEVMITPTGDTSLIQGAGAGGGNAYTLYYTVVNYTPENPDQLLRWLEEYARVGGA